MVGKSPLPLDAPRERRARPMAIQVMAPPRADPLPSADPFPPFEESAWGPLVSAAARGEGKDPFFMALSCAIDQSAGY